MIKLDIKEAMRRRGIDSQSELGRKAGIDPVTLSFIIRNKRWPHRDTLDRLCRALDCHPGELISRQ